MKKKVLFNPVGNDETSERKLVGGNSTNIMNLNNVKYKWGNKLYRTMMENFWIPEKVDLSTDISDYNRLSDDEKRAFNGILSFLIFLDSIQTNNVPHISDYITAPEVTTVLGIQTFQEALHSQSYQYIVETIIPSKERNEVYDFWRTDDVLFSRNKYVSQNFQSFLDEPSELNFYRVLIANYILEGIYFYNGFNFFYNLSSRNLMGGTADVIRYINRDELTHLVIFQNIIKELMNDDLARLAVEMFKEAVEQEIRWSTHILGENILGINNDSIDQYTKWLANVRIKSLGLEKIYRESKYSKNPYAHLEKIADTGDKGDVKSNFFESTITSYNQSSAVEGWDDF